MSLESRYDHVLGDMLSVLQEALIRLFTNSNYCFNIGQVNMTKFQLHKQKEIYKRYIFHQHSYIPISELSILHYNPI